LKLKHQNDNINYPLQSMIFFTIKKITFKTMSIAFFSNGKVHKGSKYVKMISQDGLRIRLKMKKMIQ